jgi:hypothetical protein
MSGQVDQTDAVLDARGAWVRRVLGLDVARAAASPGDFRSALARGLADWQRATEATGKQIEALRSVLLATSDPGMHKIAEFGLNGITGKLRVGLETALRELARAPPSARPKAAEALAASVAAFRGFLAVDKRIAACDRCPTVPVSLRQTFGAGLDSLDRMLKSAA